MHYAHVAYIVSFSKNSNQYFNSIDFLQDAKWKKEPIYLELNTYTGISSPAHKYTD
jgi:hypothetical protein